MENDKKMKPEEEIERFFSRYSIEDRKYIERSSEYRLAIKRGKTVTALEIASVLLSNSLHPREQDRDIRRIFKKEFPEISN
jgi:hypothetical protein